MQDPLTLDSKLLLDKQCQTTRDFSLAGKLSVSPLLASSINHHSVSIANALFQLVERRALTKYSRHFGETTNQHSAICQYSNVN
jgi:hypothetical protein